MTNKRLARAFAASTMAVLLVACEGSGGKSATPTVPATRPPAATVTARAPEPTEDAGPEATRVAESTAATLGPALLNSADYPADLLVQSQRTRFVEAGDVPGVNAEASGYFVTLASSTSDEFVTLVVLATGDEKAATAALGALTPAKYLAGLTGSAPDAKASSLDLSGAPPGSQGFAYSGTLPGASGRAIDGQAVGFVRGGAYVLLTHGTYAPSTRGVDVAKIASAISARLNDQGALN